MVEANCSKNSKKMANCSKNMGNCSKNMDNCSKNMEIWRWRLSTRKTNCKRWW